MKRLYFSLLSGILLLALGACSSDEPLNSSPGYTCHLYVLFEDASGGNPMLDLDLEEEPDPEIEFSEYNKILIQKSSYFVRLEGEFAQSRTHEWGAYDPNELGYTWLDGKAYANFNFIKQGEDMPELGICVRCEKLFGHNEEHVIEAEYAQLSKDDRYRVDCVRFTFDGVEYPVSEGGRVTVPISRD